MPNILANIARVASATTGTGTLTLGSAITGFNTFADAGITDGQTVTYAIEDYDAGGAVIAREVGAGTYTASGTTLTRDTVYSSTNGGSRINCSGSQQVFITVSKEDIDTLGGGGLSDGDYGDIVVSGGGTVLSIDSGVATTFGRSLIDDADNTAARTTLGLGTAAVQNTGTSGANLPFLNGTNTWSGPQTFQGQTHTFEWSDDGAATGPVFNFRRVSASPAIGDSIAGFNWVAKDDAGNDTGYALIEGIIVDPTNGSEDGRLRFWVYQAGTQTAAMRLGLGLVVGTPTGSELGNGTVNAVTLYENGTSLAAKYQAIDTDLTAIAGLATNGLIARTGSGTAATRTITAPAAGITVTNGDGVAGNPTLALANDLAALEALSGTNTLYYRSGADTWSAVTIGANLTFSGGTLAATGGGTLGDGDYGDITVSVSGTALTIDNDAVTYAKMQNAGANTILTRAAGTSGDIGETALAASQLLGRGATGDIAAITLGTNLSMSGTTLNATGGGGGITRGQVVAQASLMALT